MNALSKSTHNLTSLLIVFLLVFCINQSFAKDENSVIIATVDNVKGLIDLTSVNSICSDIVYEEFKFIGIPGEISMYNKDCVCDKYKQFKKLPNQTSELFMKLIRNCKLNIQLNSLENATQFEGVKGEGGFTVPEDTEEETETEQDKILQNEAAIDVVNLFPNPAETTVTMEYSNNQDLNSVSFTLYNAIGQEVALEIPEFNTTSGSHEVQINISHLQSGVYFYTFLQDGVQVTDRLIVR